MNSNDIFENYKKGELGLYLLNMETLNKYNNNILIYSSGNQVMNIYSFNYNFPSQNLDYSGYKYSLNVKLFFIGLNIVF